MRRGPQASSVSLGACDPSPQGCARSNAVSNVRGVSASFKSRSVTRWLTSPLGSLAAGAPRDPLLPLAPVALLHRSPSIGPNPQVLGRLPDDALRLGDSVVARLLTILPSGLGQIFLCDIPCTVKHPYDFQRGGFTEEDHIVSHRQ